MSQDINRRQFALGSASLVGAGALNAKTPSTSRDASRTGRKEPFALRYAPPLGMFSSHAPDPVEQVHWIADQGFTAIEDNGMAGRPKEQQEASPSTNISPFKLETLDLPPLLGAAPAAPAQKGVRGSGDFQLLYRVFSLRKCMVLYTSA